MRVTQFLMRNWFLILFLWLNLTIFASLFITHHWDEDDYRNHLMVDDPSRKPPMKRMPFREISSGMFLRNLREHDGQREMQTVFNFDHLAPIKDQTDVCAVKTDNACAIERCDPDDTSSDEFNYRGGFIHRDDDIRGAAMRVSGSAMAGSGCAMSNKYKFIYIHVLKSGGISLKGFLKDALCGTEDKVSSSFSGSRAPFSCKAGMNVLQIVDCAQAIRQHPDYFVWSFIRNPYSRFYSGYAMAAGYKRNPHDEPKFSFEDFALHPDRRRALSRGVSSSHYLPQTAFLFDRMGCPVFDYLGHLEKLNEDLKTVLEFIGSPELIDYAAAMNGVHHTTGTAFGKALKSRDPSFDLQNVFNKKLQQSTVTEYASDFRLLGYDERVIPMN